MRAYRNRLPRELRAVGCPSVAARYVTSIMPGLGALTHRLTAARNAAAVLAAVVALAGLSACGEDTNSGAGSQSTPTKGSSSAPAKKKNSSNSDGGAGGGGGY